ncbi:MAG: HNH endonuclease [Armatimonadota bacterium]
MNDSGKHTVTDSEAIRRKVAELIASFESDLKGDDLRTKVLALVPVFGKLRDLGKSLLPTDITSARNRIIYYFCKYPNVVISGNELLVVSGIQDYPRRIRELRVQFGWSIASGITMKEMLEAEDSEIPDEYRNMKPDEYVLLSAEQDRDAAHRWNIANSIRRQKKSVQSKILEFLRANVERGVTGEELRYVANNKTEWARRVRELRTEQGWPVATKSTGRPDLSVGIYVLQADRQGYEHDRHIPDEVRRAVLRRDKYTCQVCCWTHDLWNPSDPRHLELHHLKHHVKGGDNSEGNLQTMCNICHDVKHRKES